MDCLDGGWGGEEGNTGDRGPVNPGDDTLAARNGNGLRFDGLGKGVWKFSCIRVRAVAPERSPHGGRSY